MAIKKLTTKQLGRFFCGDFGHTHYSHIYAIGPRDGGNIKFGQALNVKSRFSGIQTGSPVKLKLHGTVYVPSDTEFAIHEHLAEDRSHGEWFYPSTATMRIVELIASDKPGELLKAIGLFKYLPKSIVEQVNFDDGMAAVIARAAPQMASFSDLFSGYRKEEAVPPK